MTILKITPEELYEKLKRNEKIFLLDVRAEEKYNEFHITDSNIESSNIPKMAILELEGNGDGTISILSKEKEILVTCTTGNSATKCANVLAEKDYNVIVLEGGITAWKEYLAKRS